MMFISLGVTEADDVDDEQADDEEEEEEDVVDEDLLRTFCTSCLIRP